MKYYPLIIASSFFLLVPYASANDYSASLKHSTEIPRVMVSADEETSVSAITTPSNIIVVSKEQIKASGATNLAQFLYTLGNIQLSNAAGDNSQLMVSIRGFGDNSAANSLILVDGMRLTDADLSAPDLNAISLPSIERIEIIPGSEGTLYGDQAVGGIINIVTRHPKKFTVNALAGAGSYQQNVFNGFLANQLANGFAYQLSGQADNARNYRDHNRQGFYNMNGQVGYNYQSGSIFFRYINYANNLLYPGSLTAEQIKINRHQAWSTDYRNSKNAIYQLGFDQVLNENWTLAINLADRVSNQSGVLYSPFRQNTDVNSLEIRAIRDNNRQTFTLGTYLESDSYKLNSATIFNDVSAGQNNFFIQDVLHLTNKLNATLGARMANQTNRVCPDIQTLRRFNNPIFVSEQGLSYQLNTDWRIYVRRDGNFRFPKADEAIYLPIGITQLNAQTGVSYESGVEWHVSQESLKFSIYQLDLQNEIAFDPTKAPGRPFGSNRNLDPTKRNGLQLSLNYPVWDKLSLLGGFAYVDPRFRKGPNAGHMIPGVSAVLGSLAAYYYLTEAWQIYLAEQYIGPRYASNDDKNLGPTVGGYCLTNIGLHYSVRWFSFVLQVNNVFNKYYNSYTIMNPSTAQLSYYPAPGRTVLFTVSLNID